MSDKITDLHRFKYDNDPKYRRSVDIDTACNVLRSGIAVYDKDGNKIEQSKEVDGE